MTSEAIDLSEFNKTEDQNEDQKKLMLQASGITSNPILPPATIQTRSDGKRFTTTQLESIHFDRIGLYAEGKWEGEDGDEHSLLILWDDVARIEYDHSRIKEILAENDEELVAAPE